jgi:DNA polymerase III sliding clamp (beta) subunit (PCNA family)
MLAGSGQAQMLRAVATDGHRLAQMELELPKGAAGMPGIIVPRKTVGEVQRLIEDGDAEVAIELSPGKIRFTVGEAILTSKLIDGTFPDYAASSRSTTTRNWSSTKRSSRPRSTASRRCRASAAAPSSCRSPAASCCCP